MAGSIFFDHLAVGVETWQDAYPRFAVELGGAWSHGGDAGGYAPYQLIYGHGMRLEFIAPTGGPGGFMRRFLDRNGPGPHHLTFKVPSLDDALDRLEAEGISTLGGRNEAYWREAFLHPKQAGMGTLIQLAESREWELGGGFSSPSPPDFPEPATEPLDIAWIGLTVASLDTATMLFVDHLAGSIAAKGPGWRLLSWGVGHNLLVRQEDAEPGGRPLWAAPGLGVGHVVFGPPELVPDDLSDGGVPAVPMPHHPPTSLTVLRVGPDSGGGRAGE
ncbi:VOC family protein [Sphaerimonospora mesophila]|uniref:VOC family protein n=1 Tax=Sphaerimonospora mesophila TaxID=37483 RepID=UPI0006E1802C